MPKGMKTRKSKTDRRNDHWGLATRYINITQGLTYLKLDPKSRVVDALLDMASCTNTFSVCMKCKVICKTSLAKDNNTHDEGVTFKALSKVMTKKRFNRAEDRFAHVLKRLDTIKAITQNPCEYQIQHYSNERFCKPPTEQKEEKPEYSERVFDDLLSKNYTQKEDKKRQQGKVDDLTKKLEDAKKEIEKTKELNNKLINKEQNDNVEHLIRNQSRFLKDEIDWLKFDMIEKFSKQSADLTWLKNAIEMRNTINQPLRQEIPKKRK